MATALLCCIIEIVSDSRNGVPRWIHPFLYGFMLATLMMSIHLNGENAMNPARDGPPRLFTYLVGYGPGVFSVNNYGWFWVPLVCPLVGAVLGSWAYQLGVGIHIKS